MICYNGCIACAQMRRYQVIWTDWTWTDTVDPDHDQLKPLGDKPQHTQHTYITLALTEATIWVSSGFFFF